MIPRRYSFVHSQMAGVDPKIWKAVTWFEGQKIKTKEDGSVTMTFDAADIISATRFVLEWGGEAKALKPRALVAGVRECIAALAGAHGMLVE